MTSQQLVEQWHAEWMAATGPHWGDTISWATADEIARRIDEATPAVDCLGGQPDMFCTMSAGHPGDCHLVPCSETSG